MTFFLDHDVPDDVEYALTQLGHDVIKLRQVLPTISPDEEVLRFAAQRNYILITCNRDDFLAIAARLPHAGVIILIRRRTRAQERAALVHLLDNAGESGLRDNINYA